MSKSILILGESGRGKSTAIEGLDPKETIIIKVTEKDLPFRGWKSNYSKFAVNPSNTKESKGNLITSSTANNIISYLDHISTYRPEVKNIVIDDWQYTMAFEFMNRAKETGYTKFTEIAQNALNTIKKGSSLREDLSVFYLSHSEDIITDGEKNTKIKTIGKLLDEKITIEGLFTIVLLANIDVEEDKLEYNFITQSNGHTTAKSPRGMFEYKIPNNLQLVKDKIAEYEK